MIRKIKKRVKKQEKLRKTQALLFKIFITIILFIILLIGWQLYRFLKETKLPKAGHLTVGFSSKPLIIASLLPEERTLNFLIVPEKTLILASGGYGQYRIEAFAYLQELEKKVFLLQESLVANLALPISGWIGGDLKSPAEIEAGELRNWYRNQIWQALKNNKSKIQKTTQPIETNITKSDLIRLWFYSLTIRKSKIKIIPLNEKNGLEEITFPDGSQLEAIDSIRTDEIISQFFFEHKIKKERLTIGIANATDFLGLATQASRIINNLGGLVVKIDDWPNSLNRCEIRIKSKIKNSFTVWKLKNVFSCPVNENDFGPFLTDILIVLGTDFKQKYSR